MFCSLHDTNQEMCPPQPFHIKFNGDAIRHIAWKPFEMRRKLNRLNLYVWQHKKCWALAIIPIYFVTKIFLFIVEEK